MKGIVFALFAALLFGVSTLLAKALLPGLSPVLMAGMLYLGSGIGLGLYHLVSKFGHDRAAREAPLARADWPWLIGASFFGGLLGPLLLLIGLREIPASTASLLLNLEGVLTALLAWFVFKENFDSRIALGMALILGGGVCLSWAGRPLAGVPWGSFAIIGACLAWAIDNNLTRKISAGDPVQIAMFKGLTAGAVNTLIGLALGGHLPNFNTSLAIGVIGFFGYGISLTLFVLALRHLGTARTGAYFSTAPFVGAAVAILFLGDKPGPGFLAAALLMAGGVWLHLRERHEHKHRHAPMEHEHLHVHDEHHQHVHSAADPPGEPHSHPHRHGELVHTHAHFPDIHHQHSH